MSKALIELFIRSNLLNELITVFHEKKLLPESLDMKSKFWSYGGFKFPQKGKNKMNYRLFHTLREYYDNLSLSTMIGVVNL